MNGDDIKRRRTSLGWSQERLARELGVSFSTVNRWERGKAAPRGIARKAIDEIFRGLCGPFPVPAAGEERRARRIPLRLPIRISRPGVRWGAGRGALRAGFCEDISGGGLMLKTDMPLKAKAGEGLRIFFDNGKKGLGADSEIVWTRQDGAGTKAGVRFEGLRRNDLARIVAAAIFN